MSRRKQMQEQELLVRVAQLEEEAVWLHKNLDATNVILQALLDELGDKKKRLQALLDRLSDEKQLNAELCARLSDAVGINQAEVLERVRKTATAKLMARVQSFDPNALADPEGLALDRKISDSADSDPERKN